MYVYFNGKRVSWYIPGVNPDQTVKLDTATFTPKMLPKGRIEQGGNSPPLIVIPDVPNRISTRKDGYIELILSRHYDKEAHQSRNKKVIIGRDHVYLLNRILEDYIDTIEQQVKRKPDTPMSLKQIRTINEILRELRDIITGSESAP